MTIVLIVVLMIALIPVGRNARSFGRREWLWIVGIALLQVSVAMYKMLTMEMPPLY